MQLSLFDNSHIELAGLMPEVRAAMRRVAGEVESDGRKALVDKINSIAKDAQVRLTGGNVKAISKDTLDKWLSLSDVSHPPSIIALMVFCMATGDTSPLQVLLKIMGLNVMTDEDKRFRDLGKAEVELEAARKRKKRAKEQL